MTGGTAISHPSFKPAVDAVFEGVGNDYIRNDPDGKHMRLDAHGVLRFVWLASKLSMSLGESIPSQLANSENLQGQELGKLDLRALYWDYWDYTGS